MHLAGFIHNSIFGFRDDFETPLKWATLAEMLSSLGETHDASLNRDAFQWPDVWEFDLLTPVDETKPLRDQEVIFLPVSCLFSDLHTENVSCVPVQGGPRALLSEDPEHGRNPAASATRAGALDD